MGQIVNEVKLWNSPVIGAYLLWRFTKGYSTNHSHGENPIALLHFVAYAILTDYLMIEFISNKRKNLQAYVRSFEEKNRTDILLSLQNKVNTKKDLVLRSIEIGISSELLKWDTESGKLYAMNISKNPKKGNNIRNSMTLYGNKAEILGKWFSEHSISSISAFLEVAF